MLEKDIVKLGLSDKEARVYLASLELGPSTVQAVAQKAGVNRATTYVVIDSLMEMGLMSTYEKIKKTFFTAEAPERLLEYLNDQERGIKKKIDLLKKTMPELQSISNNISNKPKVKYFEGIESLRSVQDEYISSLSPKDTIYTFLPFDNYEGSYLKDQGHLAGEERKAKKIKMAIIYTSKKGRQYEYEERSKKLLKNCLYIPYDKYPFEGGIDIYSNKIFMVNYKGRTGGVVIENKTLADTLAVFFKLLWNNLKNQKEKN